MHLPRRLAQLAESHDAGLALIIAAEQLAQRDRALRKKAAEKRAIYEGAPIPLAILNQDLHFVAVNEAWAAAHHHPVAAHVGRSVEDMLPESMLTIIRPIFLRVLATGVAVRAMDITVPRHDHTDGRCSWLLNITPIHDGLNASGVSVAALDITERRRAQDELLRLNATLECRVADRTAALQAEMAERKRAETNLMQAQRMEAVGQLTGGVAHDFNNLLTAVLGSLELAQSRVTDPGVARLLGMAAQAAQRGAKLTGQLLAFSRKQKLTMTAVDPNELVGGLDDLIGRTVGPGFVVQRASDDQLWPVSTDRAQLELCLINLLINARDASPVAGTAMIEMRNLPAHDPALPAELASGDYVRIAVRDEGHGMDDATRARCLEPFFTTKPVGRGTGLGLSMAFGTVRQSGGTLTIDSTIGCGTTVSLFLPRAVVMAKVKKPKFKEQNSDFAGLRIMLIDDDADVRDVIASCLETLGCDVQPHESPISALRELAADPFCCDALISDFAMPTMTGTEVLLQARALRPDLPTLIVTGYVDPDGEEHAGQTFVRLAKPCTTQELAQRLRQALQDAGQPVSAAGTISSTKRQLVTAT